MGTQGIIAILGTFDSKPEEHLFLKRNIEDRGLKTLTINVGTRCPAAFAPDIDLHEKLTEEDRRSRDAAIQATVDRGRKLVRDLYDRGEISGIISAGGGTGTHLGTSIMHVLPLGVPKVMVSTVASRNMAKVVGTKDITMMHSVVDLLGINSISGGVLERAAGAVCGMAQNRWRPDTTRRRVALTFFGFITAAAEAVKECLEGMDYEVIPFHANGTGGMAMEELAAEGYFHAILDLATHELADEMMGGYCRGIGPERLRPLTNGHIPRLVVPGGLDCAVLEFTRQNIPEEFRDRKLFFYDFRSAIRLTLEETLTLAEQLVEKLKIHPTHTKVLVPVQGWSEADRKGGPLYDPPISEALVKVLRTALHPRIEVREADLHINDPAFASAAGMLMDEMVKEAMGSSQ